MIPSDEAQKNAPIYKQTHVRKDPYLTSTLESHMDRVKGQLLDEIPLGVPGTLTTKMIAPHEPGGHPDYYRVIAQWVPAN